MTMPSPAPALVQLMLVPDNTALVASANLLGQRPGSPASAAADQLVLEAFEFTAQPHPDLATIAQWLAGHALPGASKQFFADKLKTDLVLLSDTDFAHFARHAMVVEPHVCIDDETGAAKGTGLFYLENLPPATLMVGLAQASVARFKKDSRRSDSPELLSAPQVLAQVLAGVGDQLPGIRGKLLQIGGDATTGRGLLLVQAALASAS